METCQKIALHNSNKTGYGLHYPEAFKLDMSHYQKVLKAKWELGILNEPNCLHKEFDKKELRDGDFIEGHASSCGFNRTVYGFVKTLTEGSHAHEGLKYIEAWESHFSDTKRGREYTFFPQRYYLKNMSSFRIVYKKHQS